MGFDSRQVLGFFLLFLFISSFVLNQVPQGSAALLIFLNKNGCLAVLLGAKQALFA